MSKLTMAYRSMSEHQETWRARMTELVPGLRFLAADEVTDPAEIDVALCWLPPPGWLASMPNLRMVHSLGAGVDHILLDPAYPAHVPLVRLVDPYMTRAMTEYVTFQVLRLHLKEPAYRRQQQAAEWTPHAPPRASERRVGILGLGELGTAAAEALVALGFDVGGWSRTPKQLAGVTCFAGAGGFDAFLARTEILVCLLPLTAATDGILAAETFAKLPRGAGLINVGRGRHVVDADLIAALDAGQLSEAVLDVFSEEPLPTAHPFWRHPQVAVTPHVAALTNPGTASLVVAENLRRLAAGEPWPDRVDLASGY